MNTKAQFADGRRISLLLLGAVLLEVACPGPTRAADFRFFSNLGLLDRLTGAAVAAAVDSLDLPAGEPVTVLSRTWHEANWFVGNKMAEELARRGHSVRVLEWSRAAGEPARPASGVHGDRSPRHKAPLGDHDAAAGERSVPEVPYGEDTQAFADSVQAYADSVAAASIDPLWGEVIDPDTDDREPPATKVEPPRRDVERPGDAGQATPPTGSRRSESGVDPDLLPEGNVLDVRILEFGVQYSDVGRKLLFGPLQFTRVGGVFFQTSLLRGPEGTIHRMTSSERHKVDRLSGAQRHLAEGASYPFSKPELTAPSLGRYVEPAVVVVIVGSLVYLFYANQN